jgi:hypothetical protein
MGNKYRNQNGIDYKRTVWSPEEITEIVRKDLQR